MSIEPRKLSLKKLRRLMKTRIYQTTAGSIMIAKLTLLKIIGSIVIVDDREGDKR